MPRITARTNAEQREDTRRRILRAFGELLFSQGLSGLTMTQLARHAGVGRTAVYNYFADIEELLVAYTLDETGRFMSDLRRDLLRCDNPVDQLAIYVRTQINDLATRHLPPGPTMRSVLSPASFAKLADHVGDLNSLLEDILRTGMRTGYLPLSDATELAKLAHSALAASASSQDDRTIDTTVLFIQRGVGARFNASGRPVPLG